MMDTSAGVGVNGDRLRPRVRAAKAYSPGPHAGSASSMENETPYMTPAVTVTLEAL